MNDQVTERLTLRLTSAEREVLQVAAGMQGVSLEEFITASALARAQAVTAPASDRRRAATTNARRPSTNSRAKPSKGHGN